MMRGTMNLPEKAHLQLVRVNEEMANRREIKALVEGHKESMKVFEHRYLQQPRSIEEHCVECHKESMKVVESAMYQGLLEKLVPILRKSKQEGFNLKPYTETLAADAEIDLFDDLEGI